LLCRLSYIGRKPPNENAALVANRNDVLLARRDLEVFNNTGVALSNVIDQTLVIGVYRHLT